MSPPTRSTSGLLTVTVLLLAAVTFGALVALWPSPVTGETVADEFVTAKIDAVDISDDTGFGPSADVTVTVLDGPFATQTFVLDTVPTTTLPTLSSGDRIELEQVVSPDGTPRFHLRDFRRAPALLVLIGLFVGAVLLVGRWHGFRALLGLAVSLFLVVRFIVPAILAGSNPAVVALVGAVAVMLVALYLTYGFNAMTASAAVGTAGALAITVGIGVTAIDRVKISGYATEEAVYAGMSVAGLDLRGIVLAGLIIAALGVLDDVTVSQASTVFALHDTDRTLTWRPLFTRAMTVGRDHISAVVNTLFLAYAGASLALLVLLSTSGVSAGQVFNSELFAEELVKILVGSLGLIAAVPCTTLLAALAATGRGAAVVPADDAATDGEPDGDGGAGSSADTPPGDSPAGGPGSSP